MLKLFQKKFAAIMILALSSGCRTSQGSGEVDAGVGRQDIPQTQQLPGPYSNREISGTFAATSQSSRTLDWRLDSTHSIRNFSLETTLSFCNHSIYQKSLRYWKNRNRPGGNPSLSPWASLYSRRIPYAGMHSFLLGYRTL